MNPSSVIARAVRSLKVAPATMEKAAAMACGNGDDGPEAARRLYREWVNDLVVMIDAPAMEEAADSPDTVFLSWLGSRLTAPFHIPYLAQDAVRAGYGDEIALLFSQVRWEQEVAWAHRMRGHDNDRIVFLAGIWIRAALRDPAKLFRGLARTYAEEVAHDAAYSSSQMHLLEAGQILDGDIDFSHWRPLWLRFAEREFGPMVNGMPRAKLTLVAQQVRDTEYAERMTRQRASWARRIRKVRPALMVAVLQAAIAQELSSDDLVAAETAFIGDIESGAVDVGGQAQPPWRLFIRTLPDWQGRSALPDSAETARRLEAMQGMRPSWTDRLPEDFRAMGAGSQRRLLEWFDEIVRNRTRQVPADPAVDYGMWLTARCSMR